MTLFHLLISLVILLFLSPLHAIDSSTLNEVVEPLKIALNVYEDPIEEVHKHEDFTQKLPLEIWNHILSFNSSNEALPLRNTNYYFIDVFDRWGMPTYMKLIAYDRSLRTSLSSVFDLLDEDAGIYPETEQALIGDISGSLQVRDHLLKTNRKPFLSVFHEHLEEKQIATDALLTVWAPQLIEHFLQENPSLCRPDSVSEDIDYLRDHFNIPPYTTIQSLKRLFNMIARNRPFMVAATCVSISVFIVGVLYFYHQPRIVDPFKVYWDFYNQSMIDERYNFKYDYPMLPRITKSNGWGGETTNLIPYANCYQNCLGSRTFFWNNWTRKDGYHGSMYLIKSEFHRGNLSDWIGYVCSKCSCNATQWLDYMKSILNGARLDPAIALCTPNLEKDTISCGSAWLDYGKTWEGWESSGARWSADPVGLRIAKGNATCVQELAPVLVYQLWKQNLILWCAFTMTLPFTFLFLMLFSIYCL